jgi:plastocyanin
MRGSAIALVAAIGGTLLVPAAPLADEPPTPPTAALEAASTTVPAGKPVELDSSASQAGTGAIVGHVWDLDGNGSFETDSADKPKVDVTPAQAGPLTVRVRVVDDHGLSGDAKLDLSVTAAPEMTAAGDKAIDKSAVAPAGADGGSDTPSAPPASAPGEPAGAPGDPSTAPSQPTDPAAPAPGVTPSDPVPAQPTAGAPPTTATMSATPALLPPELLATGTTYSATAKTATGTTVTAAAASTGVTIKDFKFGPASSSVNVGDTITWTNEDVAPHTATANDGSFDTGSLSQGKSGSHTFTKAGTFPYICSIHPSMKGTVTVAAAGGDTGGGAGTDPGSAGGTTATPAATDGSSLPQTGLDIAVVALLAALMMAAGTALRRTAR